MVVGPKFVQNFLVWSLFIQIWLIKSESCGLAVEYSAHSRNVVGSIPMQCQINDWWCLVIFLARLVEEEMLQMIEKSIVCWEVKKIEKAWSLKYG